ncbi:tRNA(adenine34) deaminase [Natranaerovirga hydrolytica]|uniref:tRNA-specific adenosine deaminase n=1 Tax=Natranaerovirga hydrolytica TaxID=680378 RepID=A0A4R1N1W6_9FIRM|nr:tRNA adenosine(34) deaminase TadA [Natranaerovirga hydrolytica]TCL00058.1 tRNA(adenine34) deaminase [Natranaerovirga hydrolytica]
MEKDYLYMKEAIIQAKKAYAINEVPIGCVIVYEDKIIGRGYNRRNTDKSTLAHAEILAIKEASNYLEDWRLDGCKMYVTLEPCPMCAGAIVQGRLSKIIIGAKNLKSGSAGSIVNILQVDQFNHQVEIISGIMEQECAALLKQFFSELRNKEKR